MRRLITILVLLVCPLTLAAQQIVLGSRAPRIDRVEWFSDRPNLDNKPMVVEFFHSSNADCLARIDECNRLASLHPDSLNYIMVVREPQEQVAPLLFKEYQYYYIACDEDGSLFKAYGVSYVPNAFVVDSRRTVRWSGNPQKLSDREIVAPLKHRK